MRIFARNNTKTALIGGESMTNWEYALFVAREYHAKKQTQRHERGIDYDEDGEAYNAFPQIVKNALNYLCEIGEIH
jgi:hypothetical protein